MEKTPILPLLAVNFVGTLGFSIVVPFLVILVTKWGGNAVIYGVLATTYSAFQLVGAPILGRYTGHRAGHALTNALLRAVFADPQCYRVVDCDAQTLARLPGAGVHWGEISAVA